MVCSQIHSAKLEISNIKCITLIEILLIVKNTFNCEKMLIGIAQLKTVSTRAQTRVFLCIVPFYLLLLEIGRHGHLIPPNRIGILFP